MKTLVFIMAVCLFSTQVLAQGNEDEDEDNADDEWDDKVKNNNETAATVTSPECGNKKCEKGESRSSCPKDCKETKKPVTTTTTTSDPLPDPVVATVTDEAKVIEIIQYQLENDPQRKEFILWQQREKEREEIEKMPQYMRVSDFMGFLWPYLLVIALVFVLAFIMIFNNRRAIRAALADYLPPPPPLTPPPPSTT